MTPNATGITRSAHRPRNVRFVAAIGGKADIIRHRRVEMLPYMSVACAEK
jgi:hypothetical protein